MATFRKRNGKWQAIVRHKDICTRARSFHTKQAAIKWAVGEEWQLTEGVLGVLKPSDVTLGKFFDSTCLTCCQLSEVWQRKASASRGSSKTL